MRWQKSLKIILSAIVLVTIGTACSAATPIVQQSGATETPAPTPTPEAPIKILFIGDSLTYS